MKDNTSKTLLFKNLFMRKRSERHMWLMHVQGSAPVAAVNVTRDIPVFNVLIYSLTLVVTFPTLAWISLNLWSLDRTYSAPLLPPNSYNHMANIFTYKCFKKEVALMQFTNS